MTNYINIATQQYPVTERDIRQNNPNVSYPSPFNPGEEYAVVFPYPQPDHDPIVQIVREIAPVLTQKNTWEQRWEVIARFQEYTDEEGVVHTVAEQESAAIAADKKSKVPQSVTMRQARLALHKNGLLVQVDTAIESFQEPDRTEAKIEWEYATSVDRNKALVEILGPALGLSEEELDDLFILAATL